MSRINLEIITIAIAIAIAEEDITIMEEQERNMIDYLLEVFLKTLQITNSDYSLVVNYVNSTKLMCSILLQLQTRISGCTMEFSRHVTTSSTYPTRY